MQTQTQTRKMHVPGAKRTLSRRIQMLLAGSLQRRESMEPFDLLEILGDAKEHPERLSKQDNENLRALVRRNGFNVSENATPQNILDGITAALEVQTKVM